MNQTKYYLGFSHCMGIGPLRFNTLLKHFGDVKTAYKADKKTLPAVLGDFSTEKFTQFRNEFNIEEKLKELEEKKITVLTRESNNFPPQLLEISDPPICLYVKGNLKQFDWAKQHLISVVGTRKPTAYGQQITRKLVAGLVDAGFIIVSGMAIGIDAIAHETALEFKGKTVAVLGSGVDIVYPTSNKKLYDAIVGGGGVVVSEFPPGMASLPGLFIARNRLISGISRGVLVIEGAEDSGALVTARYAAQQGKEVFAPPGPITSQMSQAPNILLKNGAKLVTSVEDILEELNVRRISLKQGEVEENLDEEEKKIVELLQRETLTSDDMVLGTGIVVHLLLRKLSQLELKGLIEKNNEGKYQLK